MIATGTRPWEQIPVSGPILRPAAAADYVGYSLGHFYELISQRQAPPFVKLGARASGVPKSHLDAFLAGRAEASQ